MHNDTSEDRSRTKLPLEEIVPQISRYSPKRNANCYSPNGASGGRSWRPDGCWRRPFFVVCSVVYIIVCCSSVEARKRDPKDCTPCPSKCKCPVLLSSPLECGVLCPGLGMSSLPRKADVPEYSTIVSLNFSNNRFTTFAKFDLLSSIRSISIYDNPLSCDCQLAGTVVWIWGRQSIGQLVVEQAEKTVCKSPTALSDRPITSISLDQMNCAANTFASCIWPTSVGSSFIVFTYLNGSISEEAGCRQLCFDRGATYGLFVGTKNCLCGEVDVKANLSCSCVSSDGVELVQGAKTCSFVYLRGVWSSNTDLISVAVPRVYSSHENVQFKSDAKIDFESLLWTREDLNAWNIIESNSSVMTTTFYYPGQHMVTVQGSSNNQISAPLSVSVQVYDPVVVQIPGNAEIYANVDKAIDLKASLLQGTDVRATWEYTDGSGSKTTEAFCPDKWLYINRRCVGQHSVTMATQSVAMDNCRQAGGELLEPKGKRELKKVLSYFKLVTKVYIGAQKNADGVTYNWISSGKTTYFTEVNVTGSRKHLCVSAVDSGQLTGEDCKENRLYVCQKDAKQCSNGAVYDDAEKICYLSNASQVTYQQAKTTCEDLSGHLVEVMSEQRADFLQNNVISTASSHYWIGVNDFKKKGSFYWPSGWPLGQYAPWSDGNPSVDSNHCVAMVTNLKQVAWESQQCDSTAGFVCQHPPAEATHSVQGYVTGQPGVLSPGTASNITQTATPPGNALTPTDLYIIPGSQFLVEATVQTWLVEVTPLVESTTLHLLVLRPACSEGYTLVTPDCVAATHPFSVCSSAPQACSSKNSKNCRTGKQYCPLSKSCVSVHDPCTCVIHKNVSACLGAAMTTRRKRRSPAAVSLSTDIGQISDTEMFPEYQVTGQTTVYLAEDAQGKVRIGTNSLQVHPYDVIGYQHSSPGGVVHCSDSKFADWIQSTLSFSGIVGNLATGDSQNVTGFSLKNVACGVVALYMKPESMSPSLPYVDKYNFAARSYNFSVTAKNAISETTQTAQVHFQKSISELGYLLVDMPLQENSATTDVYVESNSNQTILLSVKQGTGVYLTAVWSNRTETKSFTQPCPPDLTRECQLYFPWSSALFSLVVHESSDATEDPVPVNFTAYNKISEMNLQLFIHTQDKVTGLVITADMSQYAVVGQLIQFDMAVATGSSILYTWDFSEGQQYITNDNNVMFNVSMPGLHYVTGTACNKINCATSNMTYTAIREGKLTDVHLFAPTGVHKDTPVPVTIAFTSDTWTVVILTLDFVEDDLTTEYSTGEDTTNTLQYSHTYKTVGLFTIRATLRDRVSNRTESVTCNITVCYRLPFMSIVSDTFVDVLQPVTFHVLTLRTGVEAEYWWAFDDKSPDMMTQYSSITHQYNITGNFTVQVTAVTCAERTKASKVISVQRPITGLQIETDEVVQVGTVTRINITRASGTDVKLHVDLVNDQRQVLHAEAKEVLELSFTKTGTHNISVSASNGISHAMVWTLVYVIGPDTLDVLDIETSPCVVVGEETPIRAVVLHTDPASLSYDWDLADDKLTQTSTDTQETRVNFTKPGNVTIHVSVSDGKKQVKHSKVLCVEEKLRGLEIHTASSLYLPARETRKLVATATLTSGSANVYTWNLNGTTSKTHTNTISDSVNQGGSYHLSVTASNNVNHVKADKAVLVIEEITDLTVSNTNTTAKNGDTFYFVPDQVYFLEAQVATGSDVTFTWAIGTSEVNKKVLIYTFTQVGSLSIKLTASNSVNKTHLQVAAQVEEPISEVIIAFDPPQPITKQNTLIKVSTAQGSNIKYVYQICVQKICNSDSSKNNIFNTSFQKEGDYSINVTASNDVSTQTGNVDITVHPGLVIYIENDADLDYIRQNKSFQVTSSWKNVQGSEVEWIVTNTDNGRHLKYTDQSFQVALPISGEYSINLTVSVGSSTRHAHKDLSVIEELSDLDLQSDMLSQQYAVVNDTYNFTGLTRTGSHITYNWTIISPQHHVLYSKTTKHTLSYQFLYTGKFLIHLEAKNRLGNLHVEKEVASESIINGISMQNNLSSVEFAAVVQPVEYKPSHNDFWPVHYMWQLFDPEHPTHNTSAKGETFICVFGKVGHYSIVLNISNDVSYQEVKVSVTVQSVIEGLEIQPDQAVVSSGDSLNFTAVVVAGSDVVYVWTVDGVVYMTGLPVFTYTFAEGGTHIVGLKALNNISAKFDQALVVVSQGLLGLHILNCCEDPYPTLKLTIFIGVVLHGNDTTYNWTLVGLTDTVTSEQQIFTTLFLLPGPYVLSVTAVNNKGTETIHKIVHAEKEIESVYLTMFDTAFAYPVYKEVDFLAVVETGSSVHYRWKIDGNLPVDIITEENRFSHRFTLPGLYQVSVIAYNNVSSVVDVKILSAFAILCQQPEITVIGSLNRRVQKSHRFSIEVIVDSCQSHSVEHKWTVYNVSCDMIDPLYEVPLPPYTDTTTQFLNLHPRTLDKGSYCLHFHTQYINSKGSNHAQIDLQVLPSPLQAVIKGGDEVTMMHDSWFTLDGSLSYDPDLRWGETQSFSYMWICRLLHTNSECFEKQTEAIVEVPPETFAVGQYYEITLLVYEAGRVEGHAKQMVISRSEAVPTSSIDCVSCRNLGVFTVSHNSIVKLLGECLNCDKQISVQWRLYLDDDTEVPLDYHTTTTGARKANLVMRKGSLQDGRTYTFVLNITSLSSGYSGYAKLRLPPSNPPSGGNCSVIHPQIVKAMDDIIFVNCYDWVDHSGYGSPLIYFIYINDSHGNWYPIYRGTNSKHTFVVAPFEGDIEKIDLQIYVIDMQGTATHAKTRTLQVMSHPSNVSNLDYLLFQVFEKLPMIERSSDHKVILGFVISVLLELNRETGHGRRDGSDDDIIKRVLLREELFHVMNESAKIQYIDDVQQAGFALKLLTQYPHETPKKTKIYKIVLHMLKEMIRFMFSVTSQGLTGDEFVPHYHLSTIGNIIESIKYDLYREEMLLAGKGSEKWEELHDLMTEMFQMSRRLTNLMLSTNVAEEEPYHYDLGSYYFGGQRVRAKNIKQVHHYDQIQILFPDDLLSQIPPETEIFQTVSTIDTNPLIWGFTDGLIITSCVISAQFGFTNGSEVNVNNLAEDKLIQISSSQSPSLKREYLTNLKASLVKYLKAEPNRTSPVPTGRDLAAEQIPGDLEFIHLKLLPGESLSTELNTSLDLDGGGALGIELSISGLDPPWGSENTETRSLLHVFVGANYVPHKYKYDFVLNMTSGNDTGSAQYNGSLVVPHRHLENDDKIFVTLTNNDISPAWNVSIATFVSVCKFYDTEASQWSSEGCHAIEDSEPHWTVCRCNHMTLYGSSVYFAPNDLNFKDLLELNFSKNPVVITTVCCIAAVCIIAMGLAQHWDKQDLRKISRIPLCGARAAYKYEVTMVTGRQSGAGTSSNVGLCLYGTESKSPRYHLHRPGAFGRASSDLFIVAANSSLGDLWKIRVWHDNTGLHPSWYLCHVIVRDIQSNHKYHFLCRGWLSLTHSDFTIERYINVAGPEELHGFWSVFNTKRALGFSDHHIFISVLDCPPHSSFSRVQRVLCCATYLYVYIFANALWFGLIRVPSEYETLTGDSPLAWNDVFVGFMASLMVLPVMLVLVQMFRYSKHRLGAVGQVVDRPGSAQTVEMDAMISMSSRESSALSRGRHRQLVSLEDLDGTSISDSISVHAGKLHRTVPMKMDRELSLDLSDTSSLGSSHVCKDPTATYWSNDGILAWPEQLPEFHDVDSRQSSASSTRTRFLRRSRIGSGKNKRKMSMTGSEMMELEEIEEVDDLWENSSDESAEKKNKKKAEAVKSDPPKVAQARDKAGSKKAFTPRTEADIDQLMEELDTAIASDSQPKPGKHKNTLSDNVTANTTNTHLGASCANITIECAACAQEKSARSEGQGEGHTVRHLHDHTCGLSRESSSVSQQPSIARSRRDSLTRYMGLRRASFPHRDHESVGSFHPLQPSSDITAHSGVPTTNLWAWSRPSTGIEVPHYIPTGPRTARQWCSLPHWCVYVAYFLCGLLIVSSALLVLLYGHQFGRDLSLRWLLACVFSIVLSALILEPIKVLLIAVFVAGVHKTVEEDVHRPGIQPVLECNEVIKQQVKIRPVSGFALLQAKDEGRKINRMQNMLRHLALYVCLLVVITMICFMYHTKDSYRIRDHVDRTLLDQKINMSQGVRTTTREPSGMVALHDVSSAAEMWKWLEIAALPWIHQYNNDKTIHSSTLKLMGLARLRQVRSRQVKCPAAAEIGHMDGHHLLAVGCYGDSQEDKGSYGIGWNDSMEMNHTWLYTAGNSHSLRYHGNVTVYPGGGYIQLLGSDVAESANILDMLQDQHWIDRGTRAVLLEFTQYNPNVDLYLVARIAFEYPNSGGVVISQQIYSTPMMRYKSGTIEPIIILQVLLSLLCVWMVTDVVTHLVREKTQYLRSVWSWLEISLAALVLASLCLYVRNVVVHTDRFRQYFHHTDGFTEFTKEAHLAYIWKCLNAFVLFLLFLMVVRQLRFIKALSLYVETLSKAFPKILGCALIFAVVILIQALTGNLWYGTNIFQFHTIGDSIGTVLAMFRAESPFFDEMILFKPHFATFFVLTLTVFMYVIVFGLLLAVISDAYRSVKSQRSYHNTLDMKDHEMIDFMMKRFKLMIGTKKPKPAFRHVKFQGLPTLSSASSHSTHFSSQSRSVTASSSSDYSDIVEDVDTMLEQAGTTWDRLLSKLEEVEASEREEELLDRQVVMLIGSVPGLKGAVPPGVLEQILPPGVTDQVLPPGVSEQVLPPGVMEQVLPPGVSDQVLPPGVMEQGLPPGVMEQGLPLGISEQALPPVASEQVLPPGISEQALPPCLTEQGLPPGLLEQVLPPGLMEQGLPPGVTEQGLPPGVSEQVLPSGVPDEPEPPHIDKEPVPCDREELASSESPEASTALATPGVSKGKSDIHRNIKPKGSSMITKHVTEAINIQGDAQQPLAKESDGTGQSETGNRSRLKRNDLISNGTQAVKTMKKPLEPLETSRKLPKLLETSKKPLKPLETSKKPLKPLETTKGLLEPLETPKKPLEHSNKSKKPLEPLETLKKPKSIHSLEMAEKLKAIQHLERAQSPLTKPSPLTMTTQSPLTAQLPLTTQSPLTVQSPLTTQLPLTTQSPLTAQSPSTTQSPLTAQSGQTTPSLMQSDTEPVSRSSVTLPMLRSMSASVGARPPHLHYGPQPRTIRSADRAVREPETFSGIKLPHTVEEGSTPNTPRRQQAWLDDQESPRPGDTAGTNTRSPANRHS